MAHLRAWLEHLHITKIGMPDSGNDGHGCLLFINLVVSSAAPQSVTHQADNSNRNKYYIGKISKLS